MLGWGRSRKNVVRHLTWEIAFATRDRTNENEKRRKIYRTSLYRHDLLMTSHRASHFRGAVANWERPAIFSFHGCCGCVTAWTCNSRPHISNFIPSKIYIFYLFYLFLANGEMISGPNHCAIHTNISLFAKKKKYFRFSCAIVTFLPSALTHTHTHTRHLTWMFCHVKEGQTSFLQCFHSYLNSFIFFFFILLLPRTKTFSWRRQYVRERQEGGGWGKIQSNHCRPFRCHRELCRCCCCCCSRHHRRFSSA